MPRMEIVSDCRHRILAGGLRATLLVVLVLLGPAVEGAQPRLASDGAPLYDAPPEMFYGGGSGWTQPVWGTVVSGFRTFERPGHDGVDIAAPRYTPVFAAASGTVISAYCDATDVRDGSAWGCYRDGDPVLTSGCGWHVEILHSGQEITRYCHLVDQPLVVVGDFVTAGQQLGQVGSTGNSSGPHLHFEVHIDGDPGSGGAINPEPWMSNHGAPL
jgi:murein DD-endopeptidase MepM/ murein hydrolase activator NlpD